jgi:pyruvate/2-oxoglutarate dehydrogenase complex dihydrolipoamide acyltransferase (E2) component
MSTEVVIPKLGFSMSEGTLVEWLVPNGTAVEEGQPLYVLEAEKATQEIEAPASGTVNIVIESGEELAVGTVIGTIA